MTDNPSVIHRDDDDQVAIAKFFEEMNLRIAGGRNTDERSRRVLVELRPQLMAIAARDPAGFVEAMWAVAPKYLGDSDG